MQATTVPQIRPRPLRTHQATSAIQGIALHRRALADTSALLVQRRPSLVSHLSTFRTPLRSIRHSARSDISVISRRFASRFHVRTGLTYPVRAKSHAIRARLEGIARS